MKYRSALLIIILIIIVDQASKLYVKTHFIHGEEINVLGTWFRIHFLENPGMAFGMQFSENAIGKILLTSFRLVAVIVGFVFLRKMTLKGYSKGAIVCGALILSGALGNLIDSLFYGMIFTDSSFHMARFVPWGTGYGKLFHGKVVDMLYFPLFKFDAFGKHFEFFEPVFNIADAAITTGVLTLLAFQQKFLKHNSNQDKKEPTANLAADSVE